LKRQTVLLVLSAGLAAVAGCSEGSEAVGAKAHALVVEYGQVPPLLSGTGLYADVATRTLAPGVVEFKPRYQLWTDGAQKRRFIALPPGTQIDSSDMDHWKFPVGTRVWKEFARDGVLLETRFTEIRGPNDYFMGAYAWDDSGDARYVEDGAQNVRGTDHDIPRGYQCGSCHRGEPGRILGFSAIQLSKPPGEGPTLKEIAAAGWLSASPPPEVDYPIPGDAPTAAAMGTLHANCGHCHNPLGNLRFDAVDMILRVSVTEGDPRETALWHSTVGRPLQDFSWDGFSTRIVPGSSATSAVSFRMSVRGDRPQMPYLGTEHVDEEGLQWVRAWIDGMAVGPEPQPQPQPPAPIDPGQPPQPDPGPQPVPGESDEPPPGGSPDHETPSDELRDSAVTSEAAAEV
jgi:hypothetical protein